MKTENWFIDVTSKTTGDDLKRKSFTWTLSAPELDKVQTGQAKLTDLIEIGLDPVFFGCEVTILTPLHHNAGVVNPDTHKFEYTK